MIDLMPSDRRRLGSCPDRVVDHTQDRSVFGDVGEVVEHRAPEQQRARGVANAATNRDADRFLLRFGKQNELALLYLEADAVESGEGKIRL
jgi:hypothetical protein